MCISFDTDCIEIRATLRKYKMEIKIINSKTTGLFLQSIEVFLYFVFLFFIISFKIDLVTQETVSLSVGQMPWLQVRNVKNYFSTF